MVSPGIRLVEPRGDVLNDNRRTTYRSAAMRLAYLSQEHPELVYAAIEVARSMQTPDEALWMTLKHAPRVVGKFEKQAPLSFLDEWTDRNHAGCTKTRRSTSAAAFVAGHLPLSWVEGVEQNRPACPPLAKHLKPHNQKSGDLANYPNFQICGKCIRQNLKKFETFGRLLTCCGHLVNKNGKCF